MATASVLSEGGGDSSKKKDRPYGMDPAALCEERYDGQTKIRTEAEDEHEEGKRQRWKTNYNVTQ